MPKPSISIGDIVTFGHYEQDNDTTNGQEPIEWRVLDKNDDGLLFVISDKVLDVKPYNTTSISITWDKSTIRSWLNGYAASYNSQHGLLRHPPRHVGSVMVITSGQLSCFMALLIQFK